MSRRSGRSRAEPRSPGVQGGASESRSPVNPRRKSPERRSTGAKAKARPKAKLRPRSAVQGGAQQSRGGAQQSRASPLLLPPPRSSGASEPSRQDHRSPPGMLPRRPPGILYQESNCG